MSVAHDLRNLLRAGIADERAVETRQARPIDVDVPLRLAVLVAANQGDRVAAARIGGRDAAVRRRGNADRHAGHDLEADALFVKKEALGASGVEDERIAPLQPRDRLAFARLFGQQVADGVLVARLRGGDADVDLLGVGARVPEQTRVDQVVVQHDVGRHQALQAADRDKSGIPWAGADQIHDAHDSRTSARIASAPCAIRSRPTRAPSAAASPRGARADARITRLPSGVATAPTSSSAPLPTMVASAPIGVWQPPPSASTTARSASSAAAASASLILATNSRTLVSSSRISIATIPCPGAGTHTLAGRVSEMREVNPSRRSPAAASTSAACSPLSSLRKRVSRLPRMGVKCAPGNTGESCATRRTLPVPIEGEGPRSATRSSRAES